MTNKIIKPIFHLTYRTDINDPPKCIEGKPLGFIDRIQFYNLYNDPIKYVRKLLSCGPKSLKEIADSSSAVKNHRFVFSTLGPKFERQIFVSQELNYITSVSYVGHIVIDLELIDKNNKILFLESRELEYAV